MGRNQDQKAFKPKSKLFLLGLLTLLIGFFGKIDTAKSNIISGISSNEINIDTHFKGSEILLFGSNDSNGDLVIVVRGPKKRFLVNKKERILGIWHNGKRISFAEVPSFYQQFSNLSQENLQSDIFREYEIGELNLNFKNDKKGKFDQNEEFKDKLISIFKDRSLYQKSTSRVNFLNETLFKAVIKFPKNIAHGTYAIEIYLMRYGEISDFQTIPIYVREIGVGAKISDFANQQPVLYGLFAIIFALFIGWLTNYIFHRFINK